MTMKPLRQLHKSESGIASLIITLVLMVVISLIVLGFAQIARREQSQALDRQLSSQAFYAAETGVNDVEKLLTTTSPTSVTSKTTCGPGTGIYNSLPSSTIDATHDVSYTCLLVDNTPSQLSRTLASDGDWVTPVYAVDSTGNPTAPNQLDLTWTPDPAGSASPNCGTNNTTPANWNCGYALIRLELVPMPSTFTRSWLQTNDMVAFLYPSSTGAVAIPYNPGNGKARISSAKCNSSQCHVTITSVAGNPNYYVRIHAYYKSTTVTMSGTVPGGPASFVGSEIQVDSTGKAQNVLRRIRVDLPLTSSNVTNYSEYGLQSRDSICKRFETAPNFFQGGTLDSQPGNPNPDPYCG